jgi:hypothetical protein
LLKWSSVSRTWAFLIGLLMCWSSQQFYGQLLGITWTIDTWPVCYLINKFLLSNLVYQYYINRFFSNISQKSMSSNFLPFFTYQLSGYYRWPKESILGVITKTPNISSPPIHISPQSKQPTFLLTQTDSHILVHSHSKKRWSKVAILLPKQWWPKDEEGNHVSTLVTLCGTDLNNLIEYWSRVLWMWLLITEFEKCISSWGKILKISTNHVCWKALDADMEEKVKKFTRYGGRVNTMTWIPALASGRSQLNLQSFEVPERCRRVKLNWASPEERERKVTDFLMIQPNKNARLVGIKSTFVMKNLGLLFLTWILRWGMSSSNDYTNPWKPWPNLERGILFKCRLKS